MHRPMCDKIRSKITTNTTEHSGSFYHTCTNIKAITKLTSLTTPVKSAKIFLNVQVTKQYTIGIMHITMQDKLDVTNHK